jgi:hypothetical protein
VLREHIRWEATDLGYATTGDPDNPFGLSNDLSLVTVAPTSNGTLFGWDQYYDSVDLSSARASFDDAFADMASRLITQFGGRLVERYVDGPR